MKKYIIITIITILALAALTACRRRIPAAAPATDEPVTTDAAGYNTEPPSPKNDSSADAVPAKSDTPSTPAPTKEPEPTMDPDTWDYIMVSGDANMHYIENEKKPETMPYEIHVNKQMNCITIYKANKKGEYVKPVKAMVCSAGRKTPLGTFTTSSKYYWKAMIHDVWAQYATRITGDILFHSVPYETHEKNTLITSYYNQLGNIASAGCVRLCVRDAKWLIENCPSGTKVVIYNSSDPGPLGKPSPIRISYQCRWDPTDPDDRNPMNHKKSTITGVKDRKIERGSHVNYLENVTAFDVNTYAMTSGNIHVDTKLNPKKNGTYKVKYTFKDSKGKTITKKARFTVVDTSAPVISGIPEKYYVRDISKISADSLFRTITLTDNGYPLDKNTHLTVNYSNNKAVITAHDDYGHTKTLNVTVTEDNEPPVIKLYNDTKTLYPISQDITESFARKRIKSVSDNIAKLNINSPKITIKPSGWGVRIIYEVYDNAGNKASVEEKIGFEKVTVTTVSETPVVNNIDSDKALKKFISVVSEDTGKPVKYSVKISRKKTGSDELYRTYKVTYKITYSSAAGNKTVSKSINVNENL